MSDIAEQARRALDYVNPLADGLVGVCQKCGNRVPFDFRVEDGDMWPRFVPRGWRAGVLCLPCLDELVALGGENVCDTLLVVYFEGRRGTIPLIPARYLASLLAEYDAQAKQLQEVKDEGYMHPDAVLEIEMRWLKQYEAQAKRLEGLERLLSLDSIASFAEQNGGREVHRSWRDAMLHQGRSVSSARMAWETLSVYDQVLDRTISRETLTDFVVWVLGRAALVAEEAADDLGV